MVQPGVVKRMKRLVEFYWDCGRQGHLSGRFVLDDEGWEKLNAAIGTDIYFGEVLGKHSEIQGTLDTGDLRVITDDQEFLAKAAELKINLGHGYNPLDYLRDEDGNEV